ncbi:nuclear transport factor 2 family protein [Aurantiacibacter gilvus]|uniref:Nuclear transport factor 2 family protein n=1 Tax=Aurantiacibacter gilvus TaxID=3139141 RepID=A0ABU9IG63_9SPHN
MRIVLAGFAAILLTACGSEVPEETAAPAASAIPPVPPELPQDHQALLASDDPQLEANKRLVYDMYRIVLQAGLADRAGEFIAEDYIQHNPNADQGLAGLQDYVRRTRPEREIEDRLELPLIHIMAEGNYVTIAFLRSQVDADGQTYFSTWFDMFRIEDGLIAEHWDPMLKTDEQIDPNEQRLEE